ncbi:unnamed protein product [Caenorhabditis angaria]|uniref:Uncharacterized protein n=1 Tax=Caenorhabditis angaria TaxID=860376 RepID=A0A9P1IC46_9PELO|nr:unnamed protein product [Caenorhabditis angaria]
MKEFYEIRGENRKCYIWESVLAMWDDTLATFWRIFGEEIFEVHLKTSEFSEICSEGYWECVEITGTCANNSKYICHSTSPKHAMEIMKVLPSCITSLSIRFDPNPLRNWEKSKIDQRIEEWRNVCHKLCPDFPENSNLIFDFQMI